MVSSFCGGEVLVWEMASVTQQEYYSVECISKNERERERGVKCWIVGKMKGGAWWLLE